MDHRTDLAPAAQAPGGSALDVPTVDALTRFTAELRRTAQSQRPVVLTGPAPDRYSAPGPDPINVRIPSAPAEARTAFLRPDGRRLFTLAELNLYAAISGTAGGAVGAVASLSLPPLALSLLGALWAIGSAVAVVRDGDRIGQH
jgi:hypothetical protein